MNSPFVMVDAPFVGVLLEGHGSHGGHGGHGGHHGGGDQQAAEIENFMP